MFSLGFGRVQRVLCIGCHADDIEIGCGGTILRLLQEQPEVEVHWVVLSGSEQRAHEAKQAASVFLAKAKSKHIETHRFRDSFFPYQGEQIKEALHLLSQKFDPNLIFTHFRDDAHQDHRLVSELTRCAFRDHLIYEYEIPKFDGDLVTPNVYVPLDEAVCQQKIKSIMRCFESQRDKPWFTEDTFWALMRLRGLESHAPSRFAEGLHCRKMTL
jgi:LmbE family N-acetylglucosaminyl deacetylase